MLRNSLRRPLQHLVPKSASNCGICRIVSLPKLSIVCNDVTYGYPHHQWTTIPPQNMTTPSSTPFDVIMTKKSSNNLVQLMSSTVTDIFESIFNGILNLKRTFQPSLLRRKRKHGFLARIATKDGRQILNRRRTKGRRALCA